MANNLYDKAREKFARAQINWETDSISAVLVDLGAYSFSQSHEFFSSVPVAARISSSVALTATNSTRSLICAWRNTKSSWTKTAK